MTEKFFRFDDEGYVACPKCQERVKFGEGLKAIEPTPEKTPDGETISLCLCGNCFVLFQVVTGKPESAPKS